MAASSDSTSASPARGVRARLAAVGDDPALRYLALALLLGVAIFGLLRLRWVESQILLPFTQVQERLACAVIGDPTAPVVVGLSCSGAEVIALCLGAILAFPVPWWRRLAGAFAGMTLIVGVNTVRIGTLGRVAADRDLFQLLHLYLWPAALIAVVTAFVFVWMRWAQGADPQATANGSLRAPGARPLIRLALTGAVLLAAYLAAAPTLLTSDAVRESAAAVAATAAVAARGLGLEASSQGGLFRTGYGLFIVTPECVLTPLLPVYLAAALALPSTWRRRLAAVAAAPALFFLLAAARLLVLALPPSLVGSHLFAVHGFRQLLLGAILLTAVAWWRQGRGGAGWARRALLALAAAAGVGLVVGPAWTGLVTATASWTGAPQPPDPQGALLLLPAFQLALFTGLWVAWGGRTRGAAAAAVALAAVAALQPGLFAAVGLLWERTGLLPGALEVRAWAVAAPLLAAWLALRRRASRPPTEPPAVAVAE